MADWTTQNKSQEMISLSYVKRGGREAYSFDACHSHLTVDNAVFRESTGEQGKCTHVHTWPKSHDHASGGGGGRLCTGRGGVGFLGATTKNWAEIG